MKNNTIYLENFSINSFDSIDDYSRFNSFVSDLVFIILEESELFFFYFILRIELDNVFSEERVFFEDVKFIV